MRLFLKYKKIFYIVIPLVFIWGIYYTAINNLPWVVEKILKIAVGPEISSSSIKFPKFGEIDIKDVKLKTLGKTIIAAPEIKITYSKESLLNFKLDEINVYNPEVIIVRKDSDINIVNAFSSGSSSEESKTKAGANVPIGIINVYNGKLTFIDVTYSRPIEEKVENLDGYVSFDKVKGIDLKFQGNMDKQIYRYSFNNLVEKYNMNIYLKDVKLSAELLQYAYDSRDLTDLSGDIDLDLTILPDKFLGDAKFSEGKVRYSELSSLVKDIDGTVAFLGDKIEVKSDFDLEGKKGKFSVEYDQNSGVDVDFILKNMTYPELESYKLLKDLNLPFENVTFKDVSVNLNYNAAKEFKVTINFLIDPISVQGIDFSNIKGKFIYKDNKFYFNRFLLNLAYKNEYINFQKDVDLYAELEPEDRGIDFKIESNILNFAGKYSSDNKILEIKEKDKVIFRYDTATNVLLDTNVEIPNLFEKYNFAFTAREEDKTFYIDRFMLENNRELLNIFGDFDLKSKRYNFDFYGENIESKNFGIVRNVEFGGNFLGKIKGEQNKFILESQFEDFHLKKNDLEIQGLRGYILGNNTKDVKVDFQGTIENLGYQEYFLQGIKYGGRYEKNKINILDFSNGVMGVKGEINLPSLTLKGKYFIKDLTNEELNIESVKFSLDDITGSVTGKIDNPEIISEINSSRIIAPNGQEATITGKFKLKNFMVDISKININENYIQGKYDLKNKKGNIILQIFEENLPAYYSNQSLKYRLIGKITSKINEEKIEAKGAFTVDRGYFQGESLPILKSNIRYSADKFIDGIVEFSEMFLYNGQKTKILNIVGDINLNNKTLNFNIPSQKIRLKDIASYVKSDIKGDIQAEGNLGGEFEALKYSVNITDGNLEVSDVLFDKITFEMGGDFKYLTVKQFKFNYLGNYLESRGDYNIENGDYTFNFKSSSIDLSFLNVFLKKYSIDNISGTANLNMTLSNLVNQGFFTINNFQLNSTKYGISIKDMLAEAQLGEKYLTLNKFEGILNDGKFSAKGFLKIPSIYDLEEGNNLLESLDYSLSLSLDQIVYKYEDYFNFVITSKLNLKNNKISGDISIVKGIIKAIPNSTKSLFKVILDFIVDKTRNMVTKSKDLGKDFEITTSIEKNIAIDVGVGIKEGIILDINQLNPIVQDVRGKVIGNGRFTGTGSKLLFLGEVDAKNGEFILGGNQYNVTKSLIVFSNVNDYIPDIDPTIIFEANATVDTGRVDVAVVGTLKNLTLNIKTGQGVSTSNLSRLFTGEDVQSETTATAFLMKSIIDSQISDMLLRPISTTVKDIFHISKFRLVSNLVDYGAGSEGDGRVEKNTNFGLGAYLEAENPIYKNKYFWIAKVGIAEPNSQDQNVENNSTVNEYDVKVERRFPSGWSWGVGVAKLPNQSIVSEERKNGLNYYIDFKFEKKYNSLVDIFKRE